MPKFAMNNDHMHVTSHSATLYLSLRPVEKEGEYSLVY